MDYFITLNGKSIDAIGEAVEKPITVIEGLKETVAEQAETIAEQAETIEDKDAEIEELETQLANAVKKFTISYNITNKAGNTSDIIVVVPRLSWGIDYFKVDSSGINGANGVIAVGANYQTNTMAGYIEGTNLMIHLYILKKETGTLVSFTNTYIENMTVVGADWGYASSSILLSNITGDAVSISFTVKGI